VVVHKAQLTDDDVTTRGTLRLTRPARAAVEAACASSYETAVVMFDAVLQRGLASRDELAEAVSRLRFRSGSPHAASALEFADERSESVGESRLRVLMANAGLPTPELQAELYDEERRLVGRVDFLFEDQRVIVEFDGETKYADDDGTIILAEKWREDRLRELGYLVIRISWADPPGGAHGEADPPGVRPRRRSLTVANALNRIWGRRIGSGDAAQEISCSAPRQGDHGPGNGAGVRRRGCRVRRRRR
jgi:hypothetical protein